MKLVTCILIKCSTNHIWLSVTGERLERRKNSLAREPNERERERLYHRHTHTELLSYFVWLNKIYYTKHLVNTNHGWVIGQIFY